jgi:glycosyltransferase involved in cell wall biosynthesis
MAMVGRIEPFAKGQDLMLEVLSMKKWRQRNLNVSIYGKGPWEGTARKIVSNRRLSNVRFGGFSTPEEIWSSHHMLALPSRHEGMSLAMLEAMWLGRPVIATAVAGAMSEVVTGYNGFLCQAPTVALWDEAMEEAWSQRHLWREIGANASRRIRQRMGNDPIQDLSIRLVTLPSE